MEYILARDLDALDTLFAEVDGFAEQHLPAVDPGFVFALKLALEEVFANMVRHNAGGPPTIGMRIEREADAVQVTLTDADADHFDPTARAAVDVTAPLAERTPGGLGIHLVTRCVDAVEYRYENRASTIILTKHLTS